MNKSVFLYISLILLFTNCQEDDPTPSLPPPPACCVFSEPSLNYNPEYQVGGQTIVICEGTQVTTNANGDIIAIQAVFNSLCTGNTYSNDWILTVAIDRQQAPAIQSGTTYTINGMANGIDPIPVCSFIDYNCQQSGTNHINNFPSGTNNYNGLITFNVDWTNNTLSGNFDFNLQEPLGQSTKSINNCTFSDLTFQHIQVPL